MSGRFAYADPPYPGQAKRYAEMRDHEDCGTEVDHPALIARLVADYPDGWALSTHSRALRALLPLCPEDVRVGAWCKPFASWKKNVPVVYGWEPVLFRTTRKSMDFPLQFRAWDYFVGTTVQTDEDKALNLRGSKSESFSFWIFRILGILPGDTLDDLFPGTGRVSRAFEVWIGQGVLWPETR